MAILKSNQMVLNFFILETLNTSFAQLLLKVIEYCTYISNHPEPEIPKPVPSDNMADFMPEWYANFVDIGDEGNYELMLVASSMDIPSLLQLSSAKIATMILYMDIK